MSWFPLAPMVHFAAFTIYIVLIITILTRNFYSTANRFAAGLLACFSIWSFCKIFLHNPDTPYYFAVLFEKISVVGWASFPVFGFWLWISLTGKKGLFNSPAAVVLSVVLPVFFILLHWTGLLMYAPRRMYYGWMNTWIQGSVFTYMFYAYYAGALIAGMAYHIRSQNKVISGLKKKQNVILYVSAVLTILVGTFFEVLIPVFRIKVGILQDVTNVYILIWAAGIFVVFFRYKFMAMDPSSASEAIINSMNEALILLDDEMNISFMNRHAQEMLGYGGNEIKGRPFDKAIYDGAAAAVFIREVTKNREFKSQDFVMRRRDGKPLNCFLSASVVMEFGDIRGIICVATDITALKIAEDGVRDERDMAQKLMAELKASYDRLKEIDILKSNFTSMVSHEFRTPLTSIKGFVSFLSHGVGGPLSVQQREFLDSVRNNSDRLLNLINDLLDVSKMESGGFSINKKPAELNLVISRCMKDLSSLSESRKIDVFLESSVKKCVISADEYRVSQAVVNLLNNAMKFSPENSRITVLLEAPLEEISIPGYADAAALVPGNYARVKFVDRGCGIPQDKIMRIFERYYQVENINTRSCQGTGLGLSIVKKIADLHGGAVWAESRGPGLGCVFTLILPEK